MTYKGSVLSYKNGAANYISAATRQGSPQLVNSNETATLEDSFGELLFDVISEKFKSKMKSGVPDLGIPSMDPLKLDKIFLEPGKEFIRLPGC